MSSSAEVAAVATPEAERSEHADRFSRDVEAAARAITLTLARGDEVAR